MDILVKRSEPARWKMFDLLGRPMGEIVEAAGALWIMPFDSVADTMTQMSLGPFSTLDAALAAIETHTRGVCRREPGDDEAVTDGAPGDGA